MRSLIRPALFAVARLGLFLSVVAWVVGHWWEVEIAGLCGSATMTWPGHLISFHTEGWYPFEVTCTERPQIKSWQSFGESFDLFEERCALPGVGFMPQSTSVMGMLSIRHWLVVTIFAVFYGVLKWVYWERGRKAVGDE